MRLYDLGGDGTQEASDRILTVPNAMSLARLLVLPWLYVELASGALGRGLAVGFLFGATDFLDGYVARRFDQVTKLGQLLDPVSDRIFIVTTVIGIVVSGLLPWWIVPLIVVRDVLFLAVGMWLMSRGTRPPAVTRLGKTATFGLMWSFAFVLLAGILGTAEDPQTAVYVFATAMLGTSLVLYWAVAVDYARTLLGSRSPAAEPPRG